MYLSIDIDQMAPNERSMSKGKPMGRFCRLLSSRKVVGASVAL
jgi:hypothetical protein